LRDKTHSNTVILFDVSPSDSILNQVLHHKEIPQITRVFGDVSSFDTVWNVFKKAKPTHIIHLAAIQVPGCRADPRLGAQVNVIGHLNIFEAVKKFEAEGLGKIQSLVYASSAAVAGSANDYSKPLEDDTPHNPRTHYGVFKIANEGNSRVYWHENRIASVGLRPHTIYGVGREVGITSGPSKAIKSTVLGRKYQIPFGGKTSFLFVEDAADVFLKCSRVEHNGAYALNMRGKVLSVEEFVDCLHQTLPESRDLVSIAPNAPVLPLAYDFNERGLEQLIGKVKYTDIKEGIRSTAAGFFELKKLGLLHDKDLQ
jgi:nucleoside-diphosphate-sugar epimerase